jgi:oxygen-independent coproporphyrinogen III oxidase
MRQKDTLVDSIIKELEMQKDFLDGAKIKTIYLGGGTPSVLSASELNRIFEKIYQLFKIRRQPEITMEANPDDLSIDYLNELKKTPINRLSIGIQSFAEEDLLFMNRAHNAIEAKTGIEYAQDAGFDNLTIDLIYGSPTTTDEQWVKNLNTAFEYDIPHISCYCLTVEPKTALAQMMKKGVVKPMQEDKSIRHFEILTQNMKKYGYIQYEISNFAQANHFAEHNTNYWLGVPYLGIGPSAHSFNGASRSWNVANNSKYIKSIQADELPNTIENLTNVQMYNEYVMTSLRTLWGCDPAKIRKNFGKELMQYFNETILPFVNNQTVTSDGKSYFLTDKGRLLADNIAMELFYSKK